MDDALKTLLDGLYADGEAHDAAEPDRLRRWRNLTATTVAVGKGLHLAWKRT